MKSGAYVGGLKTDRFIAFGQWRGRPVELIQEFLPGGSWADIEMPNWLPWPWNQLPNRPQMSLGVPLLPSDTETLAIGATGGYNSHFTALATNLVAAKMSDSVLRLGWEMNGNWFRHSAIGKEADFIAYWRQIVTTMRAVPGANFDFCFNPTLGAGTWQARPDTMYPGDAYVDSIGLDVYDSIWGNSTATPQDRWVKVQAGVYGLDWWANFATAHNKPLCFPEWGCVDKASASGGGGGDNPLFVTSFLAWMKANNVRSESYFEVTAGDGDHLLEGTVFPLAAAAYKSAINPPVAPPVPTPIPTPVPPVVPPVAVPTPVPVPVLALTPVSLRVDSRMIIHAVTTVPGAIMTLQRWAGGGWAAVMSLHAEPGADAVFNLLAPLTQTTYRIACVLPNGAISVSQIMVISPGLAITLPAS